MCSVLDRSDKACFSFHFALCSGGVLDTSIDFLWSFVNGLIGRLDKFAVRCFGFLIINRLRKLVEVLFGDTYINCFFIN